MRYFGQIITHYITTALRYADACVDSDTFSELNSAMQEVIHLEERVTALETELQAIKARLANEGVRNERQTRKLDNPGRLSGL